MACINCEQIVDSVETSAFMKAHKTQGITEVHVKKFNKIRTTINGQIPIQKVVRKGDTIFLKLFTAVLDKVFENLE